MTFARAKTLSTLSETHTVPAAQSPWSALLSDSQCDPGSPE